MLKIKDLNLKISQYVEMLQNKGFQPTRVVLFGSYAKGNPNHYSDIDLAIWANNFEGDRFLDMEKVRPFENRNEKVQLHPFFTGETVDEQPFLEEILSYGIDYSNKDFVFPFLTKGNEIGKLKS